jgi:hypothetical protein
MIALLIFRRFMVESPTQMPFWNTFARDLAVSVLVGTVLLLLLSRLIGRVQFSLSTAFWCSFVGHVLLSIIGFLIGFAFAWQPAIGAVLGFVIACFALAVIFQVFVRAANEMLARSRAIILAAIVILGDFFVASPLIELWERFRT